MNIAALMTTEEFRSLDPELALIPVGATEQHGPNLSLGVDYIVADAIAKGVAERCTRRCVVYPPLPVGLSDHHMDFAGTLSLSFDTFRGLCLDVAQSAVRHGIEKIVFVNGHMGNMHALNVICGELRNRRGIEAAAVFWMDQASDAVRRTARTERWGHACEVECSVAMAVAPECVASAGLVAGDLIEEYRPLTDRYKPYAAVVPLTFAERTRNGAFGDARLANVDDGTAIIEAAMDRTAEFCNGF